MSYPNNAPAAAWYPDPQTSGQVRWWDGQNWTEHVSKAVADAAVEATVGTTVEANVETTVALSDYEVAEHIATVTYIGRHAAGATPAPRKPSTAPRIRPRVRVEMPADARVESRVEALAYA